jgi:hypothetical protein
MDAERSFFFRAPKQSDPFWTEKSESSPHFSGGGGALGR